MSQPSYRSLAKRIYLLPFCAVALLGLFALVGWWMGQGAWVQPRPYDVPLPANAAAGALFVGLAPLLLQAGWRRTALGFALLAALGGLLALLEGAAGLNFGWDDLLVRHQAMVAGARIGRLPTALGAVFATAGLLLAWHASGREHHWRPLWVALGGSLTGAYGLAGLLGGRLGLVQADFWLLHAHVGPLTAGLLLALAAALIGLAAHDSTASGTDRGPAWLWLPVTTAGATLTLLLWVSLREREVAFTHSTTQLAINNLATLYRSEIQAQLNNLGGMAARWTEAGGTPQANWEKDAAALLAGSPACRLVSWADSSLHTRWYWPRAGHEDAVSFDHGSDARRRLAMTQARGSPWPVVAPPLVSPVFGPTLAAYAAVRRDGDFDGFITVEYDYQQMFELLDRRLDFSPRYRVEASVADGAASQSAAGLPVYGRARAAAGEPGVDARLTQSADFNLFGQRVSLRFTPRPGTGEARRQFVPELALGSGLGLTLLLGLVVHLAQTARARERIAHRNAADLRAENDERRRVEARLKLTDERLNLALDATQVGVFEWNVSTDHVIYSPSVWTSLGYDPAALPATFQIWTELMHPDDLAGFKAAITAHFRDETAFIESEYRMRHQGGDWHWFSARAKCVSRDRDNHPHRVTGTCQNITDRRRAEEALRTSQAAARLLTHVARRTGNVVFITTPAGNIEWTNDSFSRLTGCAAHEVAGCYMLDLLSSPDQSPGSLDQVTRALLRAEPVTTEVVVRSRATEQSYHLRLELQPVKNEQGATENFIAIGTDITTSVQTEAALRQAKLEADSASRAKSEFLATMSHEIRTPMNGVIGMTSLLLETDLDTEQRDYVNTIRTSGNALLSVINEILDFSKIESGHLVLECQPFEIAQCIEEALDIFALQAAGKNIELAYLVDPAVPPWISLDVTRVRQVLVNLLNNAVKFTVQGQITVEVRLALVPSADHQAPPSPHQEDGKFLIDFFVRDTGIGIPPERRHLLFKPFSQVDSSTTRKYGGTGLGLAICDRLCQLMGGAIDVEANPGGGSVFHFSVLAAPIESSLDLGFVALPAVFHDALVLVVDDLPVNRALLRHALARLRLQAVEAGNLFDAAELAVRQPIVAALIDNDLPGETGATLAQELRARHPDMPVILLTNPMEPVKRIDSADPHLIRLPKPVKPALILTLLHRQLVASSSAPFIEPAPAATNATPFLADSIPLEILLVEDNPVNQKVALRILGRLGYAAGAADNGLEALAALDERKYDLVLMDLQMPEMDGLAATQEIRRRYPAPRQPRIIALTANAVQGDRERCLAAGMDDYVSKPVKLEQIQKIIVQHFRTSKAG